MELNPSLGIGILNGWILLVLEFIIEGGLMLVFPKNVASRLLDRSGWSPKQRIFTILGKVFSLACLALIILTPLKINSHLFPIGLILYTLGLIGLVIAMFNFKQTPLDQPVTNGLYKISRHPIVVSLSILFLGICLSLGSWMALFMLILSRLFQHFGILAEEEVCLMRYGESYRNFMKQVPRYLLFF
jgi:protein-S-isoprenylcysteine O-methyltransferase Ste14